VSSLRHLAPVWKSNITPRRVSANQGGNGDENTNVLSRFVPIFTYLSAATQE
jgi:hypothetical protein